MVYLSKIYTKSGDDGTTGLADGRRIAKDHPRITAIGSVDELNASIGMILGLNTYLPGHLPGKELLANIQNDLFDLGADLAVSTEDAPDAPPRLRITPAQVEHLEKCIDHYNAQLKPLHSFVLPGGGTTSALTHMARTICRRAESNLKALSRTEYVNKHAAIYLNRLSDLLFVLARVYNGNGENDILWKPGKNQEGTACAGQGASSAG